MRIDESNYHVGNNATAGALLLYYHLAIEGRFGVAETVYIDPQVFDGNRFLDVDVDREHEAGIDQKFLREAAVIYLLCDLNTGVEELDDDFLDQEITKRFVQASEQGKFRAVPEADVIAQMIKLGRFDYVRYRKLLAEIHSKYVRQTFVRLSGCLREPQT